MATIPAPPTTIESLPNELLHMICAHFLRDGESLLPYWKQYIWRFRLVSRRFTAIGNRHLFTRLDVHLNPTSFDRLFDVSANPAYATGVEELDFNGQSWTFWSHGWARHGQWLADNVSHLALLGQHRAPAEKRHYLDTRSDATFIRRHCVEFGKMFMDKTAPLPGPGRWGNPRTYSETVCDGQTELKELLLAHRELEAWQAERRRLQEDFVALAMAFRAMPLLKSVKLSPPETHWRRFGFREDKHNTWAAFGGDKSLNAPGLRLGEPEMHANVRQLNALLSACRAASTKLDALEVEALSWRFFMQAEDAFAEDVMRSVTRLKMRLVTISLHDDHDGYVRESREAQRNLREKARAGGALTRFLHNIPNLKELSLSLDRAWTAYAFHPDYDRRVATFERNIPALALMHGPCHVLWPQLHSLTLTSLFEAEENLMIFLRNHITNLSYLHLKNIRLFKGDERSALQRMRGLIEARLSSTPLRLDIGPFTTLRRTNAGIMEWYFSCRANNKPGLDAQMIHEYLTQGVGSLGDPSWQFFKWQSPNRFGAPAHNARREWVSHLP